VDHARDWDKLARKARKKLEDDARSQDSPKSARLKREQRGTAEDPKGTDPQMDGP